MRRFGLTIDNLISCDLITADAEFVTASTDEHPDLFWGLRGGGGNFGVVASFDYLHRGHRGGEQLLRPLRQFRAPALDTVYPKAYTAHQTVFDAAPTGGTITGSPGSCRHSPIGPSR